MTAEQAIIIAAVLIHDDSKRVLLARKKGA